MQGRYVFWTLLQASNLSDPSVMEKKDPGHRMSGRLSNCLEEQNYHQVTGWILQLMQPDMQKRMSAEEALAAAFLSAAQ